MDVESLQRELAAYRSELRGLEAELASLEAFRAEVCHDRAVIEEEVGERQCAVDTILSKTETGAAQIYANAMRDELHNTLDLKIWPEFQLVDAVIVRAMVEVSAEIALRHSLMSATSTAIQNSIRRY